MIFVHLFLLVFFHLFNEGSIVICILYLLPKLLQLFELLLRIVSLLLHFNLEHLPLEFYLLVSQLLLSLLSVIDHRLVIIREILL